LDCAKRELIEEVKIDGTINNWNNLDIYIGGDECVFEFKNITHIMKARYVWVKEVNTIEFYYKMLLDCSEIESLNDIKFTDNEQYRREIALFSKDEVLSLLKNKKLTKPFEAIIKKEFLNFNSLFKFN